MISDQAECLAAANYLGLTVNSGQSQQKSETSGTNAGCTYHAFGNLENYHLVTSEAVQCNSDANRACLCAAPLPGSPTFQPTPPPPAPPPSCAAFDDDSNPTLPKCCAQWNMIPQGECWCGVQDFKTACHTCVEENLFETGFHPSWTRNWQSSPSIDWYILCVDACCASLSEDLCRASPGTCRTCPKDIRGGSNQFSVLVTHGACTAIKTQQSLAL